MKKIILSIVAVAALVALPMGVKAADNSASVSASANGHAKIIVPLKITKTHDLEFGTIAKPSAGTGKVTIPATSGSNATGTDGAVVIPSALSGTGAAVFTIVGEPKQSVNITAPSTLTLDGGTGSITSITASLDLVSSASLDDLGNYTLAVGGSIPVDAAASGNYNGTLSVTVAYN